MAEPEPLSRPGLGALGETGALLGYDPAVAHSMHPGRTRALRLVAVVTALAVAPPCDAADTVSLRLISRVQLVRDPAGGAEIVAYDPGTKRVFVINGPQKQLDIVDITDPAQPRVLAPVKFPATDGPTSVAVHAGLVAVAVPAVDKQRPGSLALLDTDGRLLARVPVGALPDSVAISPDGHWVVVADEGEPRDYCSPGLAGDPVGSISVVDVSGGAATVTASDVRVAGFEDFERSLPRGVRLSGRNASIAQDLEPEFVAISPDSGTAWVTLEENSAIAEVNLATARVTRILGLGSMDHSRPGSGLDPSDRDGGIHIAPWPVRGLYQPDAIVAFEAGGELVLATANEGEARDYECFSDSARVAELELEPGRFPEGTQAEDRLGRLKVSRTDGDADGDGQYDTLYAFGSRSISLWNIDGELLYDSGDALERITAERVPEGFNADHEIDDSFDSRSDDKGPEPEGLVVGELDGRILLFVTLERVSGVAVFDVTQPHDSRLVGYGHSRVFSGSRDAGTAGDLGPEGVVFIPKQHSPGDTALLVTGNEMSGTVAVFAVERVADPSGPSAK